MSGPMFQQRHYEAVAKQMRALKASAMVTVTEDTKKLWDMNVDLFSRMFWNDNDKFKPAKFRAACGMED
jgi:hypothetical protein